MFIQNKYTKIYYQIVEAAKHRSIDCYTENHHILPESMGGPTIPENLVTLTAREHFICHWLLTKMTQGKDAANMKYALNGMKRTNEYQERYETKITSRVYARLKEIFANQHSEFMTGRTPWNKGLTLTDEKYKTAGKSNKGRKRPQSAIDASAEKNRGKKRPQEVKDKIAKALTGLIRPPRSQEEKESRSIALKGKPKAASTTAKKAATLKRLADAGTHHSQIVKICPHCGKSAKTMTYARWHGDNCKSKINTILGEENGQYNQR